MHKKIKIVIALNNEEYKKYLKESGDTPATARYCSSEIVLWGLRNIEIVRYGTWYKRPDIARLEEEIEWIKARFKKMIKGAQFSKCRTWRYALWRTWDNDKSHVMFIGMNPSTADETNDDPTIRRCINYAKAWGYGGIYMLNLFAFRATDPREMKAAADPVGPENISYLKVYHETAGITLACWGAHGHFMRQGELIETILDNLYCLGVTKTGHPRHPLYLKANLKPIPF